MLGKDTEATSGIDNEWAEPNDLMSPVALQKDGSGDTSSSETDDESSESEEERGGIVVPYIKGLGVRVGAWEGGSRAETNDAASSGLSRGVSGVSSISMTGRRISIVCDEEAVESEMGALSAAWG